MTKVGTGAKLEDSNISAYGSKDHKDAKLNAAKTEAAWEGAGKVVGIQIWRIEKFKVIAWPKEQYGKFFDGDSYIILNTYKAPDNDSKLLYNVHFWLGAHTSQDEMGTAAYKTVELDDLLGDLPVQYREVQGSESSTFLAIFKNQISILKGGVDSGFKQVKPEEYKPRLMHCKGTAKLVRVTEVELSAKSLNDGDVFILDAGLQLYQWNGKSAGIHEKRKGAEILEAYKKERNGKPKSIVLDGLADDDEFFWKTLGGKPTSIAAATPDTDVKAGPKLLFQLSDSTGSLVKTKVGESTTTFKRDLLKSEDVFILDAPEAVYAWIGKGASKAERANGITVATTYLKESGRPSHTPVSRVMDSNEPTAFKAHFA
jgi:gelsolin